jgi:hypothetical protein
MCLSLAEKACGPLSYRLRGMHQTVINSCIRLAQPRLALDRGSWAQRPHTVAPCSFSPLSYSVCGPGVTRKSTISRCVHTRPVRPAAITGVQGCPGVTAPCHWLAQAQPDPSHIPTLRDSKIFSLLKCLALALTLTLLLRYAIWLKLRSNSEVYSLLYL